MIVLLWITAIIAGMLGLILLAPGSSKKIAEMINKIVITVNHEEKLKLGSALSLILISICSFFLIYYYTR